MSFCFLSLLSLFSFSLYLFFFVQLYIHLPSGGKGINSRVWIKPIPPQRAKRNATRKKRASRHGGRFNAAAVQWCCRDGDRKNSAVILCIARKNFSYRLRKYFQSFLRGKILPKAE